MGVGPLKRSFPYYNNVLGVMIIENLAKLLLY